LLDWGTLLLLLSLMLLWLYMLSKILLWLYMLCLRPDLLLLLLLLLLLSLCIQQLTRDLPLGSRNPLLLLRRLLLCMWMVEELILLVLLETRCRMLPSSCLLRVLLKVVLRVVLRIPIINQAWIVVAIQAVANSRLLHIWRGDTRCCIAYLRCW